SSRMAHCAHAGQIHLAHEKVAEGSGAHGVERVPLIKVPLKQLSAPEHDHIKELRIARIDSNRTDRNDDVAIAGENLLIVLIPEITWIRLKRSNAGPNPVLD